MTDQLLFNVLALETILVALTRKIGDGSCFLYQKLFWIYVYQVHVHFIFDWGEFTYDVRYFWVFFDLPTWYYSLTWYLDTWSDDL